VMNVGSGLDLAEPLKFDHASNLPFSDRGTGISFEPATAFDHSSNEPVQALGTGITLDSALSNDHPIDAGCARRGGHDGGLPGNAGAEPVVRRPGALHQRACFRRRHLALSQSWQHGAARRRWPGCR
jgi:hypothetical protein